MNHLTPSNAIETVKVFDEYYASNSHRLGRQSQGNDKYYLSIVDDKLRLTNDKTQQASSEAIGFYIDQLIKTLHSAQLSEKSADVIATESQLTIIFNRHYSKQSDPVFESLVIKMKKHSISIPKNNPFYGTDLLVLSKDYRGNLPLNGIKEKDFNIISNKVNELQKGGKIGHLSIMKPKIKLSKSDTHRLERKKILFIHDITLLCTRQLGRDMVNFLIDQKKANIVINLTRVTPPDIQYLGEEILIGYNPDHRVLLGVYGDSLLHITNFIALGHEFIHAIHLIAHPKESLMSLDKSHPKMHNMEEYATVLGWQDESLIQEVFENKEGFTLDEAFFSNWDENLKDIPWDNQSENGLRSSFSYPPRIDDYYIGEYITLDSVLQRFFEIANSDDFQFEEELSKVKATSVTEIDEKSLIDFMLEQACNKSNFEVALSLLNLGAELKKSSVRIIKELLIKESLSQLERPYADQFLQFGVTLPKLPAYCAVSLVNDYDSKTE